MRPVLVALAMLALCSTAVRGGPNANGAIVVHTNDAYSYRSTTVCTTPFGQPATCESAITRTDKASAAVVWLIASFLETASPRVAVVYFGIDFDDLNLDPTARFGFCGPAGTTEVPDVGWPSNTAGTAIGFGTPITGDTFFRFYYFRVDEFSSLPGPFLCSAINPTGGYAAFFDDNFPPLQDNITRFGCVMWYEPGYNDCPQPVDPTGACCFPTGDCVVLLLADCAAQGGIYVGDGTDCAPPNAWCAEPGACCDMETGICAFVLEAECLAPNVWHPEWTCQPINPCPERGACCEPVTGNCTYVLQADCPVPNLWFPERTCDMSYCGGIEPIGACCDTATGGCTLTHAVECGGASVWHPEWTCDPNYCPLPVAAEPATWGRIKATFR